MTSLGEKIRNARVLLGWGQDRAAYEIGCSIRTLSRWENDETRPKPQHVFGLRDKLKLSEQDLSVLASEGSRYHDFPYDEVQKEFGSFEGFLRHLIRMDRDALRYFGDDEEGDEEYWAPFFEDYGFTWGAISDGTRVVGYWHYITLTEEAFGRARDGQFVEADITDDVLEEMFAPGHYNMFISMIILEKEHRNPAAFSMLRASFENRILELAEQGFYFAHVCAYAAREVHGAANVAALQGQGARLCRALGMRDIGRSYLDEPVYYMSGEEVVSRGILGRNNAIRELYEAQFNSFQTDA